MLKIKKHRIIKQALLIGMAFLFFGCAGSPEPSDNSANEARDAAYEAIAAMERGLAGEPLSTPPAAGPQSMPGQNTAAPQSTPGDLSVYDRARPAWVDSPDSVYSRQFYVSAVGYGVTRLNAERNALAQLIGFFGQSIEAELRTVSTYTEAIMSGVIQITENSRVQEAITTSVEMNTLMGAEIADVWYDSISTYYAAAVMEKSRSAVLYADLIRSNERIIDNLTLMTTAEKNTLNGYSRYMLAASIADANRVYANVLALVGDTPGISHANLKRGEDYRIEASDIARDIPITVIVQNDRSGRIRSAFSRSLSGAGFRSGGNDSRYVLTANLYLTEADMPNQPNVFIRWVVDVNLMDTRDNSIIFPFSFNGREGHINHSEAEERVLRVAESRIADEYGRNLRDHLALLLPR